MKLLLLALLSRSLASPLGIRHGQIAHQTLESDAIGNHGAVSCELEVCSDAGVEILKAGGSSADAVIAAAHCVDVINGFHSGLGGGGFSVVRDANGSVETIDFRETMPAAGNETMYSANPDPTASTIGGLAVGVPGHLKGLALLHARHGKLAWSSLFDAAIRIAEDGFEVGPNLAATLREDGSQFILNDTLFAEVYAPNGTLATLGDRIFRPRLAKTFRLLAENGIASFYDGPMAQEVVDSVTARGGIITRDDLRGYSAIIRKPAQISYRGYEIYSVPAPASGSVVLSALKIFSFFDTSDRNESLHRLIQADRFAYAQRTQYGDPRFVKNVSALQQLYLSDRIAKSLHARINDRDQPAAFYNATGYASRESGTTAIVAIDANGQTTSLTTTINDFFGAHIMTESGIILNNEMDDFSSPGRVNLYGYNPSEANFIRPGKRPQSSISSSIVVDGEGHVVLAVGAAGGSRIISSVLQAIQARLDYGTRPIDIQRIGRWHDQLTNVTGVEDVAKLRADNTTGLVKPFAASAFLESRGYNVTSDTSGSSLQMIAREQGKLLAAADPRSQDASAAAY